MKRQLSSIDISYLVSELQILSNSRVDKIYQPSKEMLLISLHKSNEGKKILQINVGQSAFLIDKKEESETLGFGMLLRKYLDGGFLISIEQLRPERILKLTFRVKDDHKILYVEFIGKGNLILCDSSDVIINSLEHQEFKDRTIKPKEKYVFPSMKYNLFELESLHFVLESKKESIVISLATELGLGGLYSEEVCLLSGIDKSIKPKDIDAKQQQKILKSIKKIISSKIDAKLILDKGSLVDFSPFLLEFYKGKEIKEMLSFNDAVSSFYSQFREIKETEHDKRIKGLLRIIEEQKSKIEEMQKEEDELRAKGELIYHKYAEIKEIIDELNKASLKYSWREIKEKLRNHPKIKDFNEKDRKVTAEF